MSKSPDDIAIRRLGPADTIAWRALRLEDLAAHPDAFTADHDEEAARPDAFFAERLAGNVVLADERDGALLAAGGLMAQASPKRRHRAMLWGLHVRPAARGRGLGRALIDGLLAAAAEGGAEAVVLGVGVHNAPALALYRSCGFEAVGFEPRVMKIDGSYVDEILMRAAV